jgi:hypothetical protein
MTSISDPTLRTLRGLPLRRFLAAWLLVAALGQWVVGGVVADGGNPGMGAPMPPAWEASRPGSASGQPGGWRVDVDFERLPLLTISGASRRLAPASPAAEPFVRRDRFLEWGRLLLEGG